MPNIEIHTELSSNGYSGSLLLIILAIAGGAGLFCYCIKSSYEECEASVRNYRDCHFEDRFQASKAHNQDGQGNVKPK